MRFENLLFIFILFSCKAILAPEQRAINTACEQLQDSINKFWRYDSIGQHYIYNSVGLFEYLDVKGNRFTRCMETNKDTTYFVKLLGKHYRVEKAEEFSPNRMVYMLTKYPCLGNCKDYHCVSFEIYFLKKGKVNRIRYREVWCSEQN